MIKTILVSFSILGAVMSCSGGDISTNGVTSDTPIASASSSKIVKGEIDTIEISSSIEAEVFRGSEERVELIGTEEEIEKVTVELNNGALHLFRDGNNFITRNKLKAKIYLKDFSSIEANASSEVEFKDDFTLQEVQIKAKSSGSIEGNFKAKKIALEVTSSGEYEGKVMTDQLIGLVTSSGEIEIEGKAKSVKVKTTSSGEFDGEDLECSTANLSASSSSRIVIGVRKSVNANATSSARIEIYPTLGDLKKSISESSSGSIKFK